MAKAMGSLSLNKPQDKQNLEGILVGKDFQYQLIAPQDIKEFTPYKPTSLYQVQCISYVGNFELVRYHLSQLFGSIVESKREEDGVIVLCVFNTVNVWQKSSGDLVLEWEGTASNDLIADSIIATILQSSTSPSAVKSN